MHTNYIALNNFVSILPSELITATVSVSSDKATNLGLRVMVVVRGWSFPCIVSQRLVDNVNVYVTLERFHLASVSNKGACVVTTDENHLVNAIFTGKKGHKPERNL